MNTHKYSRVRPAILDYLKTHAGTYFTALEVSREMDCSETHAVRVLKELHIDGKIDRTKTKMPVRKRYEIGHTHSYYYLYGIKTNTGDLLRPIVVKIDCDGTLGRECYPSLPKEPFPFVIESFTKMEMLGWKKILCTCREGPELTPALEWCDKWGLKFDAVNDNMDGLKKAFGNNPRKVHGDIMIDDRNFHGLRPVNMEQVWHEFYFYLTSLEMRQAPGLQ